MDFKGDRPFQAGAPRTARPVGPGARGTQVPGWTPGRGRREGRDARPAEQDGTPFCYPGAFHSNKVPGHFKN